MPAAFPGMAMIDQKTVEPCITKRLTSAMQTNDTLLCGDMIDGAIEIARRQRQDAEKSSSAPAAAVG